jgi:hypothetical protein
MSDTDDLAASMLRHLYAAMDERIDTLIASGYRGLLYAWYDDSLTLRVDTTPPVGHGNVRAIELTDEAVTQYLAHRRVRGH